MENKFNTLKIQLMVYSICLLSTIATLGGLFISTLYKDNDLTVPQLIGQDIVTLIIGVPLLVITFLYSKKGSMETEMTFYGTLAYFVYVYAIYAFGVAYNEMFLVYVAIFALSVYLVVLLLDSYRLKENYIWNKEKKGKNIVAGTVIIFAFFLLIVWMGMIIYGYVTSTVPQLIIDVDHPTGLVFAFDLGFVIPIALYSGFQLLKDKKDGFTLTSVMLTLNVVMGLSLLAISIVSYNHEIEGAQDLLPLWIYLVLSSVISRFLVYKNKGINLSP